MRVPEPLIILSPPRGFSSVVSTVIGQHPELYGFPELNIFLGDTMQDIKNYFRGTYPGGLLRTIAELHAGEQTLATVLDAYNWLDQRLDWSTKKMYDYILYLIAPKIGVEKSPRTCTKPKHLQRTYAYYPKAYYLHLTRNPVAARKSIREFTEAMRRKREKYSDAESYADKISMFIHDPVLLMVWFRMHDNILKLTNTLPTGQAIRIRGEDVLSEPDFYLAQFATWMGIRTDAEAIEEMKHPENSPFACPGPAPLAPGGNDGKFMRDPYLRVGKVKEPSMRKEIEKAELIKTWGQDFAQRFMRLTITLGYN